MAAYRFVTTWILEAPLERVFDAVLDALAWPSWWPGVEEVEQRERGGPDGIGAVLRTTWKGRLPYRLVFDARATRLERHRLLEAEVDGDVRGTGRWLFSEAGGLVTVRYEWCVATTRPWMNLLAPLARPVFRSNHDWLMARGGEGLAAWLQARLLGVTHAERPPGERAPAPASSADPAYD